MQTQTPRQFDYVVLVDGIPSLVTNSIASATERARWLSAPFRTIEISRREFRPLTIRGEIIRARTLLTRGYRQPERFIYKSA